MSNNASGLFEFSGGCCIESMTLFVWVAVSTEAAVDLLRSQRCCAEKASVMKISCLAK